MGVEGAPVGQGAGHWHKLVFSLAVGWGVPHPVLL